MLHFFTYAVMAVFAENIVFSHGLGVSHLLKLVETRGTSARCITGLPILLVQLLSAPLVWAARVWFTPWVRTVLPGWLPAAALRPVIYLTCATIAMAVVWLLFRCSAAMRRLIWSSCRWLPTTAACWAPF